MEYIYYIELEHVINELQKANSKQLRSITKEKLNILQHYFNKNSIRFPLRMLLICVIEQLSNHTFTFQKLSHRANRRCEVC